MLLPKDVIPLVYSLDLDVDLEAFTFDGVQSVEMSVEKAGVRSIHLHSREIAIHTASFTDSAGATQDAETLAFNLQRHTVEIGFAADFALGAGTLALTFRGILNGEMAGFYRSSYTAADGSTRTMASTQFEALDARRCFPCVDEPAAKAQFDVTLTVPAHNTVFSNMPETVVRTLPGGKRKRVTFERTPKMSTYLLAFVVGEFDFIQGRTAVGGVAIRVYTPPGKTETGRFSLEVALKCLDLYDAYFDTPYPLPKLDMVGIPEFAAGAMENWGLVTYREVDLLIDANASSSQRQRVCTVVTHELAHQWFGNLVTMTWWDDLWLNEGFACWMQNYAADKLFPEWKMWEQFTQTEQGAAMRLDGLRTSHPIQVPIRHAGEVEAVFDAISYCKGGSVIRMATAVLGDDVFRDGLRLYMKRHAYGNTETADLWTALSEASGTDVNALMARWTEQMGFPLVSVEETGSAGAAGNVKFTQRWFLADGSAPSAAEQEGRTPWQVPLMLASGAAGGVGAAAAGAILGDASAEVRVELGEGGWVKANSGQAALFRASYSPALLDALLAQVAKGGSGPLGAEDRAALITDCLALAKAGVAGGVESLVKAMSACVADDAFIVWGAIADGCGALDKVLSVQPDTAMHAAFAAYVGRLLAPIAAALGFEPKAADDHLSKQLRGKIISMLGKYAPSAAVVAEARRRFAALVEAPADTSILPSDFKVPVMRIVLKAGGAEEYEQALGLFAVAPSNVEKKHVMHALGASPLLALKTRTLEWALRSDDVKLQDFFYPLLSVSSSGKESLDLASAFFRENLAEFKAKVGKASPSLMDAAIVYSMGSYATADKADEIEAFFAANPMPANARKVAQMVEGIRANASFLDSIVAAGTITTAFWESQCT